MVTILLAAGQSKRMNKVKLLLPYKEKTLLYWSLKAAVASSESVVVVTGFYHQEIEKELTKYKEQLNKDFTIVRNENPQEGQFSSTLVGLKALKEKDDFAIALADRPLINKKHYLLLLSLLNDWEAVRIYHNDNPGHPVLCSSSLIKPLLDGGPFNSMHTFLATKKVLRYHTEDRAWVTDIDNPADYDQLVANSKL